MKIIPVTEDLRENLPSILGAVSPSIPFSRMNPLSPSSVWAQMMKTSAMGELVIQFLLPFSIQTFPSLSYLIITEISDLNYEPSQLPGGGLHVGRVGAVVWFSQTKAAYNLPFSQPGEIFLSLLLTACTPALTISLPQDWAGQYLPKS